MSVKKDLIEVFSDGSCLNNPGIGGYAVCIVEKESYRTFSDSEQNTTNNRMEIKAVLLAFEKTKDESNVKIFADSSYVVNGFNIWMHNWIKNQWKNSKKIDVLNKDLWILLYEKYKIHKTHSLNWIKAHSNNKYNDIADAEAVNAARLLQRTLQNK